MRKPPTWSHRRAAYSLMELMVAVGVFAVGASIAYPLLVSDMNLYARNFSLNKSNNSLRYSLQTLKKDIDMAIEPPVLMSYRVSGGAGIFKPQPTAISAQATLIWVNLGPAYDMVPTAGTGTGGTVNPASGITLKRHIYSAADPTPTSPLPQVGDRLVIMFPAPSSAAMLDNVTMDGTAISKPGRAITTVALVPSDTTTATFTVGLNLTNPLPTGIVGDKTVYIAREVAYAAYPVTDSAGNVIERQLVYYPTTANMSNANVLTHDLDPTPVEYDSNPNVAANTVIQPFNYYNGRGSLSPLSVALPIRAVDYAHAIADRNLGGASTDTSATEFNVYIRSSPQLGIKARID